MTYITYLKKETKKQFSESSIISHTTQSVYNPGRGRYIYMLPFQWWHSLRSFTTGYRDNTPVGVSISPLGMYDILRVRHARCTRRSGYPDRGYTSVTAGERSRQASVTRGYRTSTTNYPEAGSTSTHMCIISDSVVATPVGVSLTCKKEKGHRTEVR